MASLLPPFATVGIDLGVSPFVMLAAMGLAGLSLFVFGLLPALHAARVQPATVLRGQAGQPGGGRGLARFRNGLVMAQIAMSMTLLILAGLFAKSLLNVNAADLGMRVDSVVTFGVAPAQNGYSPERSMQLYRAIEEELAALPGVQSASSSMVPLLTDSNWRNNVSVEGFVPTPESDEHASTNEVGPAYFDTLGIPLLAGRAFNEDDTGGSPAVAIVNRRFVEKFGLGQEAVGKRMAMGATEDLDIEIVGVVGDSRYANVKDEAPAMYYRPNRQNDNLSFMTFYARTATSPQSVMAGIRDMVARLDADLPVENLAALPAVVRQNIFLDRFVGVLSTAFAALATLLAAIGLYGVLAYSIAQRTRELGLRMALGAAPGRVWGSVLGRVGVMTLAGAAVGVAAAVVIGRFAESVLYQLSARDPLVMVAAVVLLAAVALGAGFVPARRAARINPNEALRYE
jgi:predicted permease